MSARLDDVPAAARPDAQDVDRLVAQLRTAPTRRVVGLLALLVLAVVAVIASLAIGARDIAPGTVVDALLHPSTADTSYDAAVVIDERLPRTLLAILVGAALAAAGTIMQAVTRNPLVDGSILGTDLGAAVAVVSAILFLGVSGAAGYFWFGLAGAIVTTSLVLLLARLSTGTSEIVSLVISGAAASALLFALITVVTIRDPGVYHHYRYWSVGQLVGRGDVLPDLWMFVAVGLVAALLLGGTLNVLGLGEDVAAALGVGVGRARLLALGVAVLLCAAATSATGPIGFVGLVGAHVARLLVGADYRWTLPYAMLTGAVILCAADVLGRLAPGSGEIQVGVMTAVVGTPFFIALARRRQVAAV